jgi:hypothetical protein
MRGNHRYWKLVRTKILMRFSFALSDGNAIALQNALEKSTTAMEVMKS